MIRRPLDVVADEQIQQPVTVIVEPQRRGAETRATTQSAALRVVNKRAVSRILKYAMLLFKQNSDYIPFQEIPLPWFITNETIAFAEGLACKLKTS